MESRRWARTRHGAVPVFERLGYRQVEVETVSLDDQVLTRARMRKPLPETSA